MVPMALRKGWASLIAAAAWLPGAAPLPAQPASAASPAVSSAPIGDADFNAALPPLDATAPPVPAAAAPAGPTPGEDGELARPLPAIATFDATPPPATAAEASDDTPRIRYTTELRGLKEVGLERQFRSLSALVKDGSKAANAAQVSARADEDIKLAERLMRADGFYDGVATASVDLVPDQPGQVHVALIATPGARYDLGSVTVTLAPPEPARIARDALALEVGDPIVAANIEGAEANVSLALPERGYPFARLGQRDIALDDATHRGDYTLPVDAGHKARFAGLRASGDPVFDLRHLAIFPRYRAGDVYDSRKVEDLRQALVGTSLFATIAVEPVATGTLNPDGTEDVDLLVTQAKGPWHSLSGSAGYATGEGIKAQGSYTWRNLFPPEGALTLTAIGGTLEQGASATFRRSNAGQRDRSFQAAVSVDRSDYKAYEANTIGLSASLSRQSTPIWQKRWTWTLGGEIVGTNEQGAATEAGGDRPRRNYLIGALPLQLGYDRSDDLLNPTRGFRLNGKLSPETSLQGGKVRPYARTLLQGSVYYPLLSSLVIASRVQVGSILGVARDDLAPSRRLYSGGGGSVRGFGYQELGPKDAGDNPIGGRDQIEFALEGRYRFGAFGVVPFFDAGRVGESSTPSLSGLRYGAGIGGRYYTNFGPLRVDVATPIARKPGESKVALYIGIGQAF